MKQLIGNVDTRLGKLNVYLARYATRGKPLAVMLESEDGEPHGVLSTNIENAPQALGEREFFVKTYAENQQFIEPLRKCGLFDVTDRAVARNYFDTPIWRVKDHVVIEPLVRHTKK